MLEQDFASFIKSSDKKHLNKDVYIKTHKVNKDLFRIEVINNSEHKYYFNIIRVDQSEKIQVCLDFCDENSEASFYIDSKSRIPENSIHVTFVNDGKHRYYLVGSRIKFSWRKLENELNQENDAKVIDNIADFIISKAR